MLLLGLAAVIVFSYFSTARSFNVAVTMVDDTMGHMEGYTALVYQGTLSESRHQEKHKAETEDQRLDEASKVDSAQADADSEFDEPGLSEIKRSNKVFVSDVREAYEIKGAQVFSINTTDPTYYATPTLLSIGDTTIGVIGVNTYATKAYLRQVISYFEAYDAELVVCVTRSTVLLGQFEGIDLVIVTDQEEDVSMTGMDIEGTFLVQAPEENACGVAMVAPHHVLSARVIEEA